MNKDDSDQRRRRDDKLIDEMRMDIKALLSDTASKTEILKSIEAQTIRTNGRVTHLEVCHADLENRHNRIFSWVVGCAAGVSFCGSLIWKLFVK